jgi:hypothetical protein
MAIVIDIEFGADGIRIDLPHQLADELHLAPATFMRGDLARPSDRIELLTDFGGGSAPREVYAAVYLRSPTARTATLALGPDDGARAWLDEAEVLEVSSCQGTNVDQFQAEIALSGGWQRLMVKVRDQGGGWGTYIRLLDGDGLPITDLELALGPDGVDVLDQTDSDGDGVGDVCDDTP